MTATIVIRPTATGSLCMTYLRAYVDAHPHNRNKRACAAHLLRMHWSIVHIEEAPDNGHAR